MFIYDKNRISQFKQLQDIFEIQLMKKLNSGNLVLDTFSQFIIMSFISYTISKFRNFIDKIEIFSGKFLLFIYKLFNYLFNKIINKKIIKTIDIPYITNTKQINELYKAVSWYLSNNKSIDYIKETDLEYTFEKKINYENMKSGCEINKILTKNKQKTIKYKIYDINYILDTELITIYGEKENKRENYKVKLSTYMENNTKIDILEEFCQHCINRYYENLNNTIWKQLIYINKNTKWDSKESNNYRKLDTIILQNNIKSEIKNDIELFINSEEWYNHRDIPYTRGYLFYGPPGTGKTSMIKALSLYTNRHIHFLFLSQINNDIELLELLKNIKYKETILVIEDIDAMINIVKSRNIKQIDDDNNINNNGITLSGLLNALDGVFNNAGRIMIMTTNHPDMLDSALLRPGRCDIKFLFNNCNREQIKELYEVFFNIKINLMDIEVNDYIYSPAEITSIFLEYRNDPKLALININNK